MEIIRDSVNELYQEVLWYFKVAPTEVEESRNGKCSVLLTPLVIGNTNPLNRVLHHRIRNANPFFQLMETIWMMAGSNSDWITQFNKQMKSYMDYGVFHGAYGHRWANYFDIDQVAAVIKMLDENPVTRRAYIGLWDPKADLDQDYKDLPCNVGMAFQLREDKLNGYVYNRSNDLIWGMLGTNCVHFSMLLELVATCAGARLGTLFQITCNPHIYERHWSLLDNPTDGSLSDPKSWKPKTLHPKSYVDWISECQRFVDNNGEGLYEHEWFNTVAAPMCWAYLKHDRKALEKVEAEDWRKAGELWWERNRHE